MAKSLGIVVRRPPFGTINAAEAVRHAAGAINFGIEATIILIEDGVYVAHQAQNGERIGFPSLSEPLTQFTKQVGTGRDGTALRGRVVVHGPSLTARSLSADKLVDGVEIMDDAALARLLGDSDAVLTY